MEEGEGSSSGRRRPIRRQIRSSHVTSYQGSVKNLSREGKRTYDIVQAATRRKPFNKLPGTSSTVFDNASPAYAWLPPGWLAEERRMLFSDRLYRYYFDPLGQLFSTRYEVEQICQDNERNVDVRDRVIIVIDD